MTRAETQQLQKHIGVLPDGFWGPKSIAACQSHLRRMMPRPSPWPGPRELDAFYGLPDIDGYVGDARASTRVRTTSINVRGLGVAFAGREVRAVECHELVAASLLRVLRAVAESEHRWLLAEYAGCYSPRLMRGGTRPSVHAYGAAIDLWAGRNGNRAAWPVSASMPIGAMELFAREGWTPAGAFWGRDAMHFQATSIG